MNAIKNIGKVISRLPLWNQMSHPLAQNFVRLLQNGPSAKSIGKVPFCLMLASPLLNPQEVTEEADDSTQALISRGLLAYKNKDAGKAEDLLHLALRTAQDQKDIKAITYIFDMLANIAYKDGQYGKAKVLWVEAIKLMFNQNVPDDAPFVVEATLKVASLYGLTGDAEKAELGFKMVLDKQQEKIERLGNKVDNNSLALLGLIKDYYARFKLSVGGLDDAKKLFTEAYDLCVICKGSDDPTAATLLNDLGTVHILLKDYDTSAKYFSKAIQVAKKTSVDTLPTFYVNLGLNYLYLGQRKDALSACNKALKTARSSKDEQATVEAELCLEQARQL